MGKGLKKKAMKKKGAMGKKASMKKSGMKKRVSIIAKGTFARSVVFSGRKEKTASGLKKSDLMKNKAGKKLFPRRILRTERSSTPRMGLRSGLMPARKLVKSS